MNGTHENIANYLPLQGRRVAVTRAREQSSGLVERLRALGAEVIECPAIAIAPLDDFTQLDAAIERLGGYDWVIFTSVNGVDAFAARLAATGVDLETLRARKIGAIGPATATALECVGCKPDFVPDTYVAEAIIDQIGDVRSLHVLLPRADIARKVLANRLRSKGAQVDEVAAYRTVAAGGGLNAKQNPLADLLRSGGLDAVTFTSSSTVRYTLDGLSAAALPEQQSVELLNKAKLVCIGPITAGTAREHGLAVARVAEEYTVEGLVRALIELFDADSDVEVQNDVGSK